jgi:hypothetical protein
MKEEEEEEKKRKKKRRRTKKKKKSSFAFYQQKKWVTMKITITITIFLSFVSFSFLVNPFLFSMSKEQTIFLFFCVFFTVF